MPCRRSLGPWLVLAAAAATAGPASSQGYSLSELVALAQDHNTEINESEWRVEGARAQLSKARAAYLLPRLRLETFSGLTPDAEGDVINPPSDTTGLRGLGPFARAELGFVQPLYTFGQLSNLRTAAAAGVELERARLSERRLEIALQVKELYYGILLAQDLDDLVQRLRKELEQWESELDDDDPNIPLSGTYKLRLALLELGDRDRELEGSLEFARSALAWKTGLPEDSPMLVEAKWMRPEGVAIPPMDSLFALALRSRPDWRQLQSGIRAREALVGAARSAYYPTVFLAGGVRYAVAPNRTDQHNPFVKDDYNYSNGAIFLGMRQSFEWGLLRADLQKARAEVLELRAKERSAAQGIRVDVRRAHDGLQRIGLELESSLERRRLGREWLQVAREDYELDPGLIKELVSAFETFVTVEQGHHQALHEYNLSLARLERAIGRELVNARDSR